MNASTLTSQITQNPSESLGFNKQFAGLHLETASFFACIFLLQFRCVLVLARPR